MRSVVAVPAVLAASMAIAVSSVHAAPTSIDSSAAATEPARRIGNQSPTQDPPAPPAPEEAQYRVTFVSTWTSASHPTTLPPNAHFSPVVMAAHSNPDALFDRDALASPGVESMAETGATGTLRDEVAADFSVTEFRVGTSIFGAGTNSFDVTLSQDASLVSVVSMIAPSPDWFVGINSADLFVGDAWVDRLDLTLNNYDAGTDSGANFTSSNFDTNPALVVSGPRDAAFGAAAAEAPFGNVIIERL